MLEVLLVYDYGAKTSCLTLGLYGKGTVSKMDLMTLDDGNDGLKARTQYIKERELVEVSGLLHCDVVSLNCLLLNNLPLKIERKSESFVLMTDGAGRYFRIIEA